MKSTKSPHASKFKKRKYPHYPSSGDFSHILGNMLDALGDAAYSGEDSIIVIRTPNVKGPPIARVKLLLFPSKSWPLTRKGLWKQVTGEQDYVTWKCDGDYPEIIG